MAESIADRFSAVLARLEAADRRQARLTAEHLANVRRMIAELERIDDPTRSDLATR